MNTNRKTISLAKLFLAIVGLAYLLLAAWCAVLPGTTSQAIGFNLKPGSGQSEYFVIYGGLQLAIAMLFLWPLYKSDSVAFSLLACVIIHGCIVVFRAISFFLYSGIGTPTYALAVIEWVIFLLAAFLLSRME